MSTLSQFSGGGMPVTKAIVNNTSAGGTHDFGLNGMSGNQYCGIKGVLTPALTASTLATVLSITGKGSISVLIASSKDSTSRTHRVKMTVDGVVVFDATTDACSSDSHGMAVVGQVYGNPTYPLFIPDHVSFNQSLLIEYASSLSETAKTYIGYAYRTY